MTADATADWPQPAVVYRCLLSDGHTVDLISTAAPAPDDIRGRALDLAQETWGDTNTRRTVLGIATVAAEVAP